MLTWLNHSPRFVAKGFAGDRMVFYFGSTNIDDIEISEFHFEIQLLEHEGKWSITAQWHQFADHTQKPRVGTFLSKLNLALEMHKEFDFRKYWHDWSRKDAKFAVVISNTIEPQKEYRRII